MSKFLKALEQAERDRARALTETEPGSERPASVGTLRDGAAVRVLSDVVSPAVPEPVPTGSVAPFADRGEAEPHSDVGELADVDPHLVSVIAPDSFEAEQYRSLRTSLELWRDERRSGLLGVSSPAVGDGKTTTTINLAAALAQGGQAKVLLLEADLRHPVVARNLGLRGDRGVGLVRGLREEGRPLSQLVSRPRGLGFDLVLAGDRVESPYELLKSSRMDRLIGEARERYDYVLFDTPPLVSFADCQVLANRLDGFLVVIAAHRTPRKLVEEALKIVGPEKTLGFIFNQDDRPVAGYGYYYAYQRVTTTKQGILRALDGWLRRHRKR